MFFKKKQILMDCYRYEKGSIRFILSSKLDVHNNARHLEDAEEIFIAWDERNGPIQGEESNICV